MVKLFLCINSIFCIETQVSWKYSHMDSCTYSSWREKLTDSWFFFFVEPCVTLHPIKKIVDYTFVSKENLICLDFFFGLYSPISIWNWWDRDSKIIILEIFLFFEQEWFSKLTVLLRLLMSLIFVWLFSHFSQPLVVCKNTGCYNSWHCHLINEAILCVEKYV